MQVKKAVLALCVAAAASVAFAQSDISDIARRKSASVSRASSTNGTVVFPYNVDGAVYSPSSVSFVFPSAITGTVAVYHRDVATTNSLLLANLAVAGNTVVTWIPETDYVFDRGTALVLTSTINSFSATVQNKLKYQGGW